MSNRFYQIGCSLDLIFGSCDTQPRRAFRSIYPTGGYEAGVRACQQLDGIQLGEHVAGYRKETRAFSIRSITADCQREHILKHAFLKANRHN